MSKRITFDKLYYIENTIGPYTKIHLRGFGVCYYIGFIEKTMDNGDTTLFLQVATKLFDSFFTINGMIYFENDDDCVFELSEFDYDFNTITILNYEDEGVYIKNSVS